MCYRAVSSWLQEVGNETLTEILEYLSFSSIVLSYRINQNIIHVPRTAHNLFTQPSVLNCIRMFWKATVLTAYIVNCSLVRSRMHGRTDGWHIMHTCTQVFMHTNNQQQNPSSVSLACARKWLENLHLRATGTVPSPTKADRRLCVAWESHWETSAFYSQRLRASVIDS